MKKSKPVYYQNKKYDNMESLSEKIKVSTHVLYQRISSGNYKGEKISYNPPEKHSIPKEIPEHKSGDPLLKNPCTCLISSNWRG
jgi:hypothetical protein